VRVAPGGRRVLSEPFEVFDAGRMGVFADPEGAVFCVWQPGSHRGSAAVNEHGAVNFNNLHTDDVEAAKAFYGAVFGWTTIDAGSPMWALPGYGDHLEELNPGLRAGMKQMSAPGGFEDVVATILPREGGPARWSVTFAVERANSEAQCSPSRRMRHGRDSPSLPTRLADPSAPASSWRRTAVKR
jgi:uncharacterized protein